MSSIQPRSGKFQLRVVHKLLPTPFFFTFDSREAAQSYGDQLEALLAKGIVPSDLLKAKASSPSVVSVIDEYTALAPVSDSDAALLGVVGNEVVGLRVSGITYPWVEGYVRRLKVDSNLSPGTIRKRVGALARVLDWHLLKTIGNKSGNPLRMLPVGYSAYSGEDARLLPASAAAKTDIHRDRRLSVTEIQAIHAALAGIRRKDRERALAVDPAFLLLFDLILITGLRLIEAYRLRVAQVDADMGVLRVDGSKGHRGKIKPRVVPLHPAMRDRLRAWCADRQGLVFPFWAGDADSEKKTTSRLSKRFAVLFAYAGVPDFKEHDLRHTATCQWFELRDDAGRWKFSDVEICKIMGWSNYSMVLRYASLRGEDLAKRLE